MPASLFSVPKPPNALVRERLLARLGACSDKKLVIVHAPAGQGKSTLAATYASTLDIPAVWYSLDAGDDCPAVVLRSLGQALQAALPGSFPRMTQPPRDRYGDRATAHSLTPWIRDVFGQLGRPLLLVFDDFQFVNASPVLRSLFKTLIESTPPFVRFLLLSRTRPQMEVAKLRARQAVAELTGEDLRFSDEETQALFGTVFGLPLAPAEAAEVNRAAEGWPAGLVLLNGYVASLPERDRRAALRGLDRPDVKAHIFEYLAQEVFANLPPYLQDFLLRTAAADELPRSLLARLTGLPETAPEGRRSVAAVVRELTARNLFLTVAVDGSSVRYHALFREFLRRRSRELLSAAVLRKLSLAAAGHFSGARDPARAIDILLAAGEPGKALALIESSGQGLVAQGRSGTLLRWIAALPAGLAGRPWPRFLRALARRYADPRAALADFERAYAGFRRDRDSAAQMLALSGIIESCFHAGGDFRRMSRAASQARSLLAGRRGAPDARARLLLATGMSLFFTGRLPDATDALRQALDLFHRRRDHFTEVTTAVYLTPCALYQGDFALARDAVKRGFAASDAIPEELGGRSALFLTQAMTELFEGNFEEAERCIGQCGKLADDHALASIGFLSLDVGGWIRMARGDFSGAVRMLESCRRNSATAGHPFFHASASHLLALAWMFQGRLGRAVEESDRALAAQGRSGSRLFQGIYLIASGAIRLKQGKAAAAERDLLAAQRLLRQCGAAQQEANAHLLLAALHLRRGRGEAARRSLAAGFGIGAERGFTYFAVLEQEELVRLASEAARAGIEPLYCGQLAGRQLAPRAEPFLRVHCLGEFRVFRQGVAVADSAWKSRLAKTLVKLLATRGHQRMSRDEAAEVLWPGTGADRQAQLLNSLLHRARKALDPDADAGRSGSCILQDSGMLQLNPRLVWVDIDAFADLHARSRIQRSGREHAADRTLALYDQAFDLYRGDLLPGDLYQDWSAGLRDRLRNMHHDMLKHAAAITDAPGTREAAASYYEKMFSLDPCNEKACRWLMADRMASGHRSEAIRFYDRCQLALRKELDIEPDEQTRRLYRNIIGD